MMVLLCLVCVVMVPSIWSYPTGPVESACDTMTPGHGHEPKTDPPPYSVTINATCYEPFNKFQVIIRSTGDARFKGFLAQARTVRTGTIVGRMSISAAEEGYKLLKCGEENVENAIGHSEAGNKTAVAFTVFAPRPISNDGDIQIRATIVEEKEDVYENVLSAPLPHCETDIEDLIGETEEDPATTPAAGSQMVWSLLSALAAVLLVLLV